MGLVFVTCNLKTLIKGYWLNKLLRGRVSVTKPTRLDLARNLLFMSKLLREAIFVKSVNVIP